MRLEEGHLEGECLELIVSAVLCFPTLAARAQPLLINNSERKDLEPMNQKEDKNLRIGGGKKIEIHILGKVIKGSF